MSGTFFGAKGVNHIGAEDFASLMDSIFDKSYVLSGVDDGLTATMTDANTVTVSTGGAILDGYYYHNEEEESLAVASGSVGYNRIDLLSMRYTQGEVDGNTVQDVTWTVIQGDATVGTPEWPSYHEGSIDGGDVMVDYIYATLTIEGVQTPVVDVVMPKTGPIQSQVSARGAYATCSTAAGTAAKVVDYPGFVLTTGATVYVRFANANTAASATLNVNSTGAKAIYNNNSTTAANLNWVAGETVPFVYDGSVWRMVNSAGLVALRESVSHETYDFTYGVVTRFGDVVSIFVKSDISSSYSDGDTIFTLPSSMRPKDTNNRDFPLFSVHGNFVSILRVKPDGIVTTSFGNIPSGTQVRSVFTFVR